MKVYATERNADRVVVKFLKDHPELEDVSIRLVSLTRVSDQKDLGFAIEALLPSGATDTLRTRLEDLGFRTVRGPEGPAEEE